MSSRLVEQAAQPSVSAVKWRLPEDLDFTWVLSFLRPRAVAGVELVSPDSYARAVQLDSISYTIHLSQAHATLHAETSPPLARLRLRMLVTRLLDLDADLSKMRRHLSGDDVLRPVIVRHRGVRLLRFPDPFEAIVRAILGQQVSLAAAATTAARMTRALTSVSRLCHGAALRPLPGPESIAGASEESLRAIGLTGAKARALRAAARAVVSGDLDLHALATAPPEQADEALCALPGVGPWTAAYVRMRGFGDGDAFPAADLGVLKALAARLGVPRVTARDAVDIAERWRPWRGYATLHLWQSLSTPG